MSSVGILAILWVLASTVVALLPMRLQYLPGGFLLFTAPMLIVAIGVQHGWAWMIPAVLAFLSMYRNPLRYFWRKWRGLPVEDPE